MKFNMKAIQEQIEIMQHYANGGEVECLALDKSLKGWYEEQDPSFSWGFFDYRIKEQKNTITIEKWLCKDGNDSYYIAEVNDISGYEKVKLLEFYEVEL